MMLKTGIAVATVLTLSACGFSGISSGDSGLFGPTGLRGSTASVEGIRFRSRVSATTEDNRGFTVATAGAGRAIEAAVEAGRVEAVRYCLTRFGGSEIAWGDGPDQEVDTLTLSDRGALIMTGTCIAR